MITSKKIATVMSAEAERFVAALNEALHEVRATGSAEEFERFKRAVASIVGEMEMELFMPMYALHPDLEPESVRKARDDS
jgi:hypothetical protein